jgi:hypothetical protein
MSNNTKVLTYLIDHEAATARSIADAIAGLTVQQSQNACSELYRIGVLDRNDKQHTYKISKAFSKRANLKLLVVSIRDGKTGTAALTKLVASVGGTSRRTPMVSTTSDGVPMMPVVSQPIVTLTAAPKKIPTIPEVVSSKTYKVAVRQQLSKFVGDVENWNEELAFAKGAASSVDTKSAAKELKRLTTCLFDRLQELAWLRESLQELAVAEGLDPSLFDGIGMGESENIETSAERAKQQ